MDAGDSVEQGPTVDLIRKPQNEGRKRFLGAMSTPWPQTGDERPVSTRGYHGQDYV